MVVPTGAGDPPESDTGGDDADDVGGDAGDQAEPAPVPAPEAAPEAEPANAAAPKPEPAPPSAPSDDAEVASDAEASDAEASDAEAEPDGEADAAAAPPTLPTLEPAVALDPSRIVIDSRDLALEKLLERIADDELVLPAPAPDSVIARSRAVESLLVRIPLSAVYLDGSDDDRWIALAGGDELAAIAGFVAGDAWALTGLEFLPKLEGQRFADLPRDLRRRLHEARIAVHVIRPGTPLEVRLAIARRVNATIAALSPQEARAVLAPGPALAVLERVSRDAADGEALLAAAVAHMLGGSDADPTDCDLDRGLAALNTASADELAGLEAALAAAVAITDDVAAGAGPRWRQAWLIELTALSPGDRGALAAATGDLAAGQRAVADATPTGARLHIRALLAEVLGR